MVCSCWPSDSSRRRTSMSKYIPGNQKHLTLEDRKYIEKSLNAGYSFKDIARYLCKDPTTISKKSGCTGSATGITKAVLTMHITFASTDIIAKSQCLWQDHSLRCQMYHLSNLQPDMSRLCQRTM
ncbi:MAG: helix-turn-helix domain-containing protein [Anaerobutyricum sp.]